MIKILARSALTNTVERAIRKGIKNYLKAYPEAKVFYIDEMVSSIVNELGSSVEDMLDIIRETFKNA